MSEPLRSQLEALRRETSQLCVHSIGSGGRDALGWVLERLDKILAAPQPRRVVLAENLWASQVVTFGKTNAFENSVMRQADPYCRYRLVLESVEEPQKEAPSE